MSLSIANVAKSDLSTMLVAMEMDVEGYTGGRAAAAERVGQKLCRRLSRLVSPAGSEAIVSRALHLARQRFPALGDVRPGRVPELCFQMPEKDMHELDADELADGLVEALCIMLDLLRLFIGHDLTLRLVREVWPDQALGEPGRPGNSDGQEVSS